MELITPINGTKTEAEKQLAALRLDNPDAELFILGDPGGPFEGVFRAPSSEVWRRLKSELRNEQTRMIADWNLIVGCLLWPSAEDLKAAASKRAALPDILSSALADEAGAGQSAVRKK